MKSTIKAVLLSVLMSCAYAPQALTQQIPNSAISAKPNRALTAQKKTAPTKSWSNPKLRISLPTTATKFKFSKDGKTLFTNGANERSAELWDLTSGKRISTFPATPGFSFCDVALSPDGQFAAGLMYSGSAPTSTKRNIELLVWNLKTGQSRWVRPIQNHAIKPSDTQFCQVEFSPNSRLLATNISGMSNKLQSGVRIWNVLQGTLQQVTPMAVIADIYSNRNYFAFSPDSSVLGVMTKVKGNTQLHLWNLNTRKLQGKLQAVHEGNLLSLIDIVFSPNQQDIMAFSSDGIISSYIHRWQIKTGKLQQKSPLSIDRTDGLLALSPDSQTFVYGGDVTGYHIGNFQTNKRFSFPQGLSPTSGLTRVVFSPDGQQMAILSNNQTINVLH